MSHWEALTDFEADYEVETETPHRIRRKRDGRILKTTLEKRPKTRSEHRPPRPALVHSRRTDLSQRHTSHLPTSYLSSNVYGPKLIENISLFEHSSSMIIEFLPSK